MSHLPSVQQKKHLVAETRADLEQVVRLVEAAGVAQPDVIDNR